MILGCDDYAETATAAASKNGTVNAISDGDMTAPAPSSRRERPPTDYEAGIPDAASFPISASLKRKRKSTSTNDAHDLPLFPPYDVHLSPHDNHQQQQLPHQQQQPNPPPNQHSERSDPSLPRRMYPPFHPGAGSSAFPSPPSATAGFPLHRHQNPISAVTAVAASSASVRSVAGVDRVSAASILPSPSSMIGSTSMESAAAASLEAKFQASAANRFSAAAAAAAAAAVAPSSRYSASLPQFGAPFRFQPSHPFAPHHHPLIGHPHHPSSLPPIPSHPHHHVTHPPPPHPHPTPPTPPHLPPPAAPHAHPYFPFSAAAAAAAVVAAPPLQTTTPMMASAGAAGKSAVDYHGVGVLDRKSLGHCFETTTTMETGNVGVIGESTAHERKDLFGEDFGFEDELVDPI